MQSKICLIRYDWKMTIHRDSVKQQKEKQLQAIIIVKKSVKGKIKNSKLYTYICIYNNLKELKYYFKMLPTMQNNQCLRIMRKLFQVRIQDLIVNKIALLMSIFKFYEKLWNVRINQRSPNFSILPFLLQKKMTEKKHGREKETYMMLGKFDLNGFRVSSHRLLLTQQALRMCQPGKEFIQCMLELTQC